MENESTNELSALSRREQIYSILREKGSITVKEISDIFGVSNMTIRRDLHIMEEQGILIMHYGGATLRNAHPSFMDFDARQETDYNIKIAIAKKASEYIKENDILYMDTSTTVNLMTRFLPNFHLTIVTNALSVMNATVHNPNIKVYFAPGFYSKEHGGSMDYKTSEYLANMHYTAAFLGAASIDADFGLSSCEDSETLIKRIVIKNTDRNYLLADHSKFGRKDFNKIADIKDFELIFTDSDLYEERRRKILANGGRISLCYAQ